MTKTKQSMLAQIRRLRMAADMLERQVMKMDAPAKVARKAKTAKKAATPKATKRVLMRPAGKSSLKTQDIDHTLKVVKKARVAKAQAKPRPVILAGKHKGRHANGAAHA